MNQLANIPKQLRPTPRKLMLVLFGKTLGISRLDISRLSLTTLKYRANNNFRQKIKRLHPDGNHSYIHQTTSSVKFRSLVRAAKFFRDLPNGIRKEDEIEYYPTPWEWSRDQGTPEGYQEFSPGP